MPRASKRKLSASSTNDSVASTRPRRLSTRKAASTDHSTSTSTTSSTSRRKSKASAVADDEAPSTSSSLNRVDPPSASRPSTSHRKSSHASSSHSSTSHHKSTSDMTPENRSSLHRFAERKGEVLSFGSGDMSQLGLGDADNMRERKKPTVLRTLEGISISHISAGSLHNAVIAEGGSVYTWGCNDDSALGREGDEFIPALVDGVLGSQHHFGDDVTTVVQLACGASHTVALTAAGEVWAWGTYRDANGVMGFTGTVDTAKAPTHIPIAERVVMIAAGENHDVALTEKGHVLQWGDVGHGQRTGDRHKKSKLQPTTVVIKQRTGGRKSGSPAHIDRVYAGGAASFAVTADGQVYSWGPNNYSQTGHRQHGKADDEDKDEEEKAKEGGEETKEGEEPQKKRRKKAPAPNLFVPVPTLVPGLPPILKIASAVHHTLFLTTGHKVFAVGKNTDGRLGLGHQEEVKEPMEAGPEDVWEVGVGEAHSLLVVGRGEEGGQLWTCGSGDLQQIGHGGEDTAAWKRVESQQLDAEDRRVLQAVGGSQHSLLLATHRRSAIGLTEEEEKKM